MEASTIFRNGYEITEKNQPKLSYLQTVAYKFLLANLSGKNLPTFTNKSSSKMRLKMLNKKNTKQRYSAQFNSEINNNNN